MKVNVPTGLLRAAEQCSSEPRYAQKQDETSKALREAVLRRESRDAKLENWLEMLESKLKNFDTV